MSSQTVAFSAPIDYNSAVSAAQMAAEKILRKTGNFIRRRASNILCDVDETPTDTVKYQNETENE